MLNTYPNSGHQSKFAEFCREQFFCEGFGIIVGVWAPKYGHQLISRLVFPNKFPSHIFARAQVTSNKTEHIQEKTPFSGSGFSMPFP